MNTKLMMNTFWKLILCSIIFLIGLLASDRLLEKTGFVPSVLPAGIAAISITLWFLAASMLLALALSFVASRLRVNWLARWVILTEVVWVFACAVMVVVSIFFMPTGLVPALVRSFLSLLNFLLPVLLFSGAVVIMFPPARPAAKIGIPRYRRGSAVACDFG